uniref:Uncharacterized protein n=1 Tax=Anopheles coluzzii TaxID=1518534 RepID=A0A8W7Q003_ANOCL
MEDRLLAALHRLVRFPFRSIGRAPDMIGTGGPFIGMAVRKRDTAQLVSAGQQDNVMQGWAGLAEGWAKLPLLVAGRGRRGRVAAPVRHAAARRREEHIVRLVLVVLRAAYCRRVVVPLLERVVVLAGPVHAALALERPGRRAGQRPDLLVVRQHERLQPEPARRCGLRCGRRNDDRIVRYLQRQRLRERVGISGLLLPFLLLFLFLLVLVVVAQLIEVLLGMMMVLVLLLQKKQLLGMMVRVGRLTERAERLLGRLRWRLLRLGNERQGGGGGLGELLAPHQPVVLAESGRFRHRRKGCTGGGRMARRSTGRTVQMAGMGGHTGRTDRMLPVVLVRCAQIRRRQLVEVFAFGRRGGRLRGQLLAQYLLLV